MVKLNDCPDMTIAVKHQHNIIGVNFSSKEFAALLEVLCCAGK